MPSQQEASVAASAAPKDVVVQVQGQSGLGGEAEKLGSAVPVLTMSQRGVPKLMVDGYSYYRKRINKSVMALIVGFSPPYHRGFSPFLSVGFFLVVVGFCPLSG